MSSTSHAASMGTAEEFLAGYRPADAVGVDGHRLVELALTNDDPGARISIASRLLDDGADPAATDDDGTNLLHVLLGSRSHDFEAEAPLLGRLLDGGADPNAVHRKFGTPLETLAAVFKFGEPELTPFYDVLLARPDLDLLQVSVYGRTVLDNVRGWGRPELTERLEEYLRARGVAVPAPDPS
ncbi:hypothetical protein [Nocardioides speluncae]|uniref:hypothetical protein n=1 Tax=Nocardioides speluncae TaxID=2670337 RepID=UPI0012B17EDD|nr:hypothetical protein [Nocardioides speluncae]